MSSLGIVVAGEIGAGVNDVISSVTMKCVQKGIKVIGFHGGYHMNKTEELNMTIAHKIKATSGSYLMTQQPENEDAEKFVPAFVAKIKEDKIKYLIAVIGSDFIEATKKVAVELKGACQVIVVPMSIENEIAIPANCDTIGFQTAATLGAELVNNLNAETNTQPRYFFVEVMGRASGHLALTVAAGSASSLSIGPEDFKEGPISLDDIINYASGALIKRLMRGFKIGIVVISEGLVGRLDDASFAKLYPNETSRKGIILDDAEIGRFVSNATRDRLSKAGLRFGPKKFGHELRGRTPVAADVKLATVLGCAAVAALEAGKDGIVLCFDGLKTQEMALSELSEAPRTLCTCSEEYKFLKGFQNILSEEDMANAEFVATAAKLAKVSEDEFKATYGTVAKKSII